MTRAKMLQRLAALPKPADPDLLLVAATIDRMAEVAREKERQRARKVAP